MNLFYRCCRYSWGAAAPSESVFACAAPAGTAWQAQFLFREGSNRTFDPVQDVGGGLTRSQKSARVEAVLFVSDAAISAKRLAQFASLADSNEAFRLVEQLNAAYDAERSAFRIERAANGFLLLTRPSYARWLSRIHHRQAEIKLSPPALETLTVIAYRQPITRADIEVLRGVHCTEMLKQLMERGLVRIAGEDNSLGRPYVYETTRKFLEMFGLRSLDELPMAAELRITAAKNEAA